MTYNHIFCVSALAAFSLLGANATELPESYNVQHAKVVITYDSSVPQFELKITPADYITYKEDGSEKTMTIDMVDKIEIMRGGNDANGDYHNSTYIITELTNLPAGKTTVYKDKDIQSNGRYIYYVRTYLGEDHDWPDMNEVYSYLKPGEVTLFEAKAADEKGNLPVTLSGKAPSKTASGGNLQQGDISALVFCRAPYEFNHGGTFKEIGRIENPVPGDTFSWDDTSAELNTAYSYQVYAQSGDGDNASVGESAYLMFRTGQDIPVAPANLSVVNNMTSLILSWDAVKDGENLGYVNPDDLTYTIYEFKKNSYPEEDTEVLLKKDIKGTTCELDFSDLEKPAYKNLRLRAVSPGGESQYTAFAEQIVGNPGVLPWKEDFNHAINDWGGTSSERCWKINAFGNIGSPVLYYTTYGIYYTDPYNSVGSVQYTGVDGDISDSEKEVREGMVSGFYDNPALDEMLSEPLDFSNAKNPVVSLYVYQLPTTSLVDSSNYVEVLAAGDDGEFASFGRANCFSGNAAQGWQQYFFPLTEKAGSKVAHVRLDAHAGEFPASISIDSVEIDDYPGVEEVTYEIDEASGKCTLGWTDPSTESQKVQAYTVYVDDNAVSEKQVATEYAFTMPEGGNATVAVVAHYENLDAPAKKFGISATGIDSLPEAGAEKVVYTDLAGARVTNPEKGIYIKTVISSDGSRRSFKVVK